MVSIVGIVFLILALSQAYWFWRLRGCVRNSSLGRWPGAAVGAVAVGLFLLMLSYNAGWLRGPGPRLVLTPTEAVLGAPFAWWITASLAAFLLAAVMWIIGRAFWAGAWAARKASGRPPAPEPSSPSRRIFLQRAAGAVVAAPFVGGAYGLLYGRLNLDTPLQPIRLPNLPRAFEGFRIAQISDIHIGPYMTEEEIRRYAAITNALKPDLIALTGDFVTSDPRTQNAVVRALSGLKAPYGVWGCLGNHEFWAGVQNSIPALFRQAGVRILRGENAAIAAGADSFNLLGVDYESRRSMGPRAEGLVGSYLTGIEPLVDPHRVNILLSHNPETFDRAAELGIELSLAGHTHGGQVALEFISPEIAPSRLVTPYVAGHFDRPGGQLYVNRGLGTIGVPIRLGARPEITLFELRRG